MDYIIDGYNLLYVFGAPEQGCGEAVLDQARRKLIALIARSRRDRETGEILVVFDARALPPDVSPRQRIHGVTVLFSVDYGEADEQIEELIDQHSHPKQLTVVSNDHRLQAAARRRRCRVWSCEAFLDWLESLDNRPQPQPRRKGKPERASPEEVQRWAEEFGDLNNDPAMRELFNFFDFDEDVE